MKMISTMLLTMVAMAAIGFIAFTQAQMQTKERALATDLGPQLALPLGRLSQWEVACDSMDGGAAQDLTIDTNNASHATDTMYIGNDSTTCVRVGGSTITRTTGASIGDGCRDGDGISIDTKGAYCLSSGAVITVDVLGGIR